MATLESLGLDLSAPDAHKLPVYRRLGLLNGLLIGLALAMGAWGVEAARVAQLPFRLYLPTLLLGMALVVALCTLTGWLTSRVAKAWFTVLLWLVTAVIAVLTIGYLGFYGRTFVVWLADRQFWGRNIYPYNLAAGTSGLILGGFLVYLVIGILAALQSYRLENIIGNLRDKTRLNASAWFGLLWPLPFVFLAAFLTKRSMFDPAAVAANIAHQAIQVAQTYEGDLSALGRASGLNYGALRGVQDQLAGNYTLSIAEINPNNTSVTVAADFENGGWIYCRLINDQLSHCYDAAPPYTTGLALLLSGQPAPEDCRGCLPQMEDEALAGELAALGATLGGDPTIERVAQWGSHVLMRATGMSGEALDCWYEGITRIYLTGCEPTPN